MKFCKRKETSKGVRASRNVFHKDSVVLWSSCRSLQSETIKKTLILRFRIFFASGLVNCVFRGAPSQRLTGRTLSEMRCNFFSDFAKFSQEEWLRWAILKAGQRSQKLLLLVMPILVHFLEDTKGEKIKRKAQSFKRHSDARTKSDQKLGKKSLAKRWVKSWIDLRRNKARTRTEAQIAFSIFKSAACLFQIVPTSASTSIFARVARAQCKVPGPGPKNAHQRPKQSPTDFPFVALWASYPSLYLVFCFEFVICCFFGLDFSWGLSLVLMFHCVLHWALNFLLDLVLGTWLFIGLGLLPWSFF